jgi:hypothetical protein
LVFLLENAYDRVAYECFVVIGINHDRDQRSALALDAQVPFILASPERAESPATNSAVTSLKSLAHFFD